jgi:hypothetical protein
MSQWETSSGAAFGGRPATAEAAVRSPPAGFLVQAGARTKLHQEHGIVSGSKRAPAPGDLGHISALGSQGVGKLVKRPQDSQASWGTTQHETFSGAGNAAGFVSVRSLPWPHRKTTAPVPKNR